MFAFKNTTHVVTAAAPAAAFKAASASEHAPQHELHHADTNEDTYCLVGDKESVRETAVRLRDQGRHSLRLFLAWNKGTFGVIYDAESARKALGDAGDAAMVEIAEALRHATVPVDLLIYACNLSDVGLNALCDALAEAQAVTFVYVDYNPRVSLQAHERLKLAVATSPSPIQNLRLYDASKTPKVEFEATPDKLRELGYHQSSPAALFNTITDWCCLACGSWGGR